MAIKIPGASYCARLSNLQANCRLEGDASGATLYYPRHTKLGKRLSLNAASLAKMRADCNAFYDANRDDLNCEGVKFGPDFGQDGRAGHDFWLTRNHHGAGFWDGDWPEAEGERLTKAAHAFGDCDLYAGDDGKVYLS